MTKNKVFEPICVVAEQGSVVPQSQIVLELHLIDAHFH